MNKFGMKQATRMFALLTFAVLCVSPSFGQGFGSGGPGMGGGMGMEMGMMEMPQSPLNKLKGSLRAAKGEAAQKKILGKIQKMLSQQYDSYLQRNEAELQDMEASVKALRTQLERRKKAKKQLLNLELQRIANEASGLVWPAHQSGMQGMGMGGMGMGMGGMGAVPGEMYGGLGGMGGAPSVNAPVPAQLAEDIVSNEPAEDEDPETITMNQIRQITLASLNFESAHQRLPSNIVDINQKPMLSWRVSILQYMGESEQALYKKFKLNEPWNSEHNVELLDEMPDIYKSANSDSNTKTVLLGFDGEGTLFESGKQIAMGSIVDGTSNTVLVAQMNRQSAVPWTKPIDVKFTPGTPVSQLAETADGTIIIGPCDGSVHRINLKDFDVEQLEYLIQRNDGNLVNFSD